jgi:hypothetical protein
MSKLRYLPYAGLTAIILAAGSASAQTTWYDAREERLQDRMDAGRRDGSLTRREYNRLENGMDRIERYERRAERDGVITPQERRRLNAMLDRQSHDVHQLRTNGQGRDLDGRHGGHHGWRHDGHHDGRHWGHHGGNHADWGNHNGGPNHDGRQWGHNGHNGNNGGSWTRGTTTSSNTVATTPRASTRASSSSSLGGSRPWGGRN